MKRCFRFEVLRCALGLRFFLKAIARLLCSAELSGDFFSVSVCCVCCGVAAAVATQARLSTNFGTMSTTREQIFADEEELPSSKDGIADAEEGGAFVELPKTPGLADDQSDSGAGGVPSRASAVNDQPNADGAAADDSDVDGLPVPAEAVDYQPSHSGLFGGAGPHGKHSEGSVDDQSAAFQEANLTITPTADDDSHTESRAKRNGASQSVLDQRPEVTEIAEHHFDNGDSAGSDGENEAASNDDHPEEAFIKLAAPSADGADPLSSAIGGGKASDDDDGSVDAMVIPMPGIKRASASGSTDTSSDGSAAAKKSRGKRGADGGARGGSNRTDSSVGGDEDDYTPNPNEVFDRTGSKVLVQQEPSAREKRGFGQISLSAELEEQSFVDALDMPPTKQIGTPVQVRSRLRRFALRVNGICFLGLTQCFSILPTL